MARKSTLINAIIWIGLAMLAAMPIFLFWYFFVGVDYFQTYYCDGVGLGTDTSDSKIILYSKDDQRQCFVVQRGSIGTFTDSEEIEILIIDIPNQRSPNRINMGDPNVRIGFVASRGFGRNYSIGERGVTGYFDITSIRNDSISVTFEIVVHANRSTRDSSPMPTDYTFTGERKFVLKDNSDVRYAGVLWSNQRPKQ